MPKKCAHVPGGELCHTQAGFAGMNGKDSIE